MSRSRAALVHFKAVPITRPHEATLTEKKTARDSGYVFCEPNSDEQIAFRKGISLLNVLSKM